MKPSIVTLLSLLVLLIITCVYQKTSDIYKLTYPQDESIVSPSTVAIIKTTIKVKKQVEVNATKEKAISKEPALVTKIKTSIQKEVASTKNKKINEIKTQEIIKEVVHALPTDTKIEKISTIETKEIVDYLLLVLQERDGVLKKRDTLLVEIEALIQRALAQRAIAIQTMEKVVLDVATHQKTLLEQRKILSENIDQNTTQNKGN